MMIDALSILQPWAWLIVRGFKPVENRNWKPWNHGLKFRGPCLIHAGKGWDKDFDDDDTRGWAEELIGADMPPKAFFDGLRGGIVGRGEIIDCVTAHDSPWFFGPQAFVIKNARPVPFIPYKGQLGFFKVDYNGAA